jgi:hypothetical protein
MTVGSGIGGQVGIAPESTYGTYVAPTRFLPITKAPIKKSKQTVTPAWMGAGRLMTLGAGRVVTTRAADGSIELPLYNHGLGLLLQALMGTSVTPVQQGATTAYMQTHTLADTLGKSLTVQVGVPDTLGVVHPYTFLGAKVADATFTYEVAKELTGQFTLQARDVSETQTLAAASYGASARPFVGTDTGLKIGAYGSEAVVQGVRKASVKIERMIKNDRYYMGNNGLMSEPLIADFAKLTGSLDADFVDKTTFADRFASDGSFSLVLEAVGLNIASTYNDTFRITLPQCFFDGDGPTLDGPGVITGTFPFTCEFDGTNLPRIEYMSADTTV